MGDLRKAREFGLFVNILLPIFFLKVVLEKEKEKKHTALILKVSHFIQELAEVVSCVFCGFRTHERLIAYEVILAVRTPYM